MDYPKLPIRAVAPRFPFLRASSYPNHKFHRSSVFILFASAMALVAAFYLLIASRSSSSQRFGVVIDAGSSGTRIHVFSVESNRGTMPLLDLGSTAVMRVTPGLSSYTGDPDRAGESLVDLLKFARGKVGKEQWADVEVRLMATAGLRMVGIAAREKILESCRRVLRASGFRFQDDWATVIPGSHEGMYAWVAANYALGTLGGVPEKTTGIIELGGASAQVTFVSNEALPPEFSHALKIGEMMYYVYSNSFLHFGQNVAHKSLLELLSSKDIKTSKEVMTYGVFLDPCSPKGYHQVAQSTFSPSTNNSNLENLSHAVGNFSACRSAAALFLDKEKGDFLHQQCYLGSTFIPKMQGNFVATENFFFTSKFFGLDPTSSLSDLMVEGTKFCEEDWSKLKEKYYTLDDESLSQYCFSSAYIVALLHDTLGIDMDDRRIEFTNHVSGVQIEWALGAFLLQSMAKVANNSGWLTLAFPGHFLALLLLVTSAVLLAVWLVTKWRRPQLKTIYDLEKGRYIVTRITK